jgi:hypothetical protein
MQIQRYGMGGGGIMTTWTSREELLSGVYRSWQK